MQELVIQVDSPNPVEIFGINNSNLNLLKKHFPELKIIARGNTIKVVGQEKQIKIIEEKIKMLAQHYNKFNSIKEDDVENILLNDKVKQVEENVLVYGPDGKIIKTCTSGQTELVNSVKQNDMVFAIGPAGTGKTYTAVAMAVKALKEKQVRRIILTRPAVEAGENLGFLPGDLKEKIDPYLQPLYDALRDMIRKDRLQALLDKETIQIAPLAFMRGRTLDRSFVILDEAQNATINQLKMFLTRMGKQAKFIITGDITQIDLPDSQPSGLLQALRILKPIEGIDFVMLTEQDIMRHKLVRKVIKAYANDRKKD